MSRVVRFACGKTINSTNIRVNAAVMHSLLEAPLGRLCRMHSAAWALRESERARPQIHCSVRQPGAYRYVSLARRRSIARHTASCKRHSWPTLGTRIPNQSEPLAFCSKLELVEGDRTSAMAQHVRTPPPCACAFTAGAAAR